MIDFDKLFEDYFADWEKTNSSKFENPDEMEAMLPDVYAEWADKPCKELNGLSPKGYFENVGSGKELADMFFKFLNAGIGAPVLMADAMEKHNDAGDLIAAYIKKENLPEVNIECINMLNECGFTHPLNEYISWIKDGNVSDDLVELAVETLKENANIVSDKLFPMIKDATEKQKEIICEILINAEKNDKTYALLEDLFINGENLPFYAGLIAAYGDERFSSILYAALDECNYFEFIEIRNAIEAIGGIVDDSYRDFSDDPYYKALKGI